MIKRSDCIYETSQGTCGPNVNGQKCRPCGCRDYDRALTPEDYQKLNAQAANTHTFKGPDVSSGPSECSCLPRAVYAGTEGTA